MKFRIRRALLSDAEEIARQNIKSWQETYRGIFPDSYLGQLESENRLEVIKTHIQNRNIQFNVAFVDEPAKTLVGYAIAGTCTEKNCDADGEVRAIYVDSKYHGKGVGKLLLDSAFEYLRSRKFHKVLISVLEANTKARAFYERQGGVLGKPDCYELRGVRYPTSSYFWKIR